MTPDGLVAGDRLHRADGEDDRNRRGLRRFYLSHAASLFGATGARLSLWVVCAQPAAKQGGQSPRDRAMKPRRSRKAL
jgi:hypothetical protein